MDNFNRYGEEHYGQTNYNSNSAFSNTYGNSYGNVNPEKPKKPRKSHSTAKKFMTAIAIALVFGLVGGLMFTGTAYVSNKMTGNQLTSASTTDSGDKSSGDSKSDSSSGSVKTLTKSSGKIDATKTSTATTVHDVSDIVENVMPSIVQVTNATLTEYRNFFYETYSVPSVSAGSGIIIAEDGDYIYIATNNHVVSGDSTNQTITITFSDETAVEGTVQGADESNDLAVVKVKISDLSDSTLNTIKVATLGDSDSVKVGDSAVVIGNAMGYGQSVTTGVISALDREVTLETDSGQTISNKLMQTDAAVNPGNSGGALLNMNGEVIGIVSAKYIDTDAEGLGYAIPMSTAESIIEALMNGDSVNTNQLAGDSTDTAYLGIYGVDISVNAATTYGMPEGVYVSSVVDGTGAAKAGIEKKDIITAINGNTVTSMSELQSYLQNFNPGDTVTLTVAKNSANYATKEITVTLSGQQK